MNATEARIGHTNSDFVAFYYLGHLSQAYEELVDEVIKAFKKHSEPSVLSTAALTLRTMQGYELLRTSHEGKIDALGATIVDTFLTVISQVITLFERDTCSGQRKNNQILNPSCHCSYARSGC